MKKDNMMQVIQESEFIVLVIGIGVIVFILLNWKHLKPLTSRNILLLSFCLKYSSQAPGFEMD